MTSDAETSRDAILVEIRKLIASIREDSIKAIRAEAKRMKPAPCPLAELTLDEDYPQDAGVSQMVADSIVWAALERRRIMVLSKGRYVADCTRASRKPPTAFAVDLAEHYIQHPEKLEDLHKKLLGVLATKAKPAAESDREPAEKPREAKMLSAGDEYLKSIGMLGGHSST